MSGISLSTIRARNAEFRRQQEILEAKHVAEELAVQAEEEEKKVEEEKPAKKPSKRKYLVVDEEAPKEEDEGE